MFNFLDPAAVQAASSLRRTLVLLKRESSIVNNWQLDSIHDSPLTIHEQNDEGSDTTGDDQCDKAGNKNK